MRQESTHSHLGQDEDQSSISRPKGSQKGAQESFLEHAHLVPVPRDGMQMALGQSGKMTSLEVSQDFPLKMCIPLLYIPLADNCIEYTLPFSSKMQGQTEGRHFCLKKKA